MSEYSFKVSIAILFPLETVDFLSILVFINQHRKFVLHHFYNQFTGH